MYVCVRLFCPFAIGLFFVVWVRICEGTLFVKDGFVGIGLNLARGKCPETANISCPCWRNQTQATVVIPVCSYVHRFKTRCKPCDKSSPEDVCPKFQNCHQCSGDGGDRCATCPDRKFGKWCENSCECVNGARCDREGKCICSKEFEGRRCEIKKGCPLPAPIIAPPLQAVLTPPEGPITAVYSCQEGYELSGQAISTCLSNKQWSSPVPKCFLKCPLLSAPANGRLEFSGSELVQGVTAKITCHQHFRLNGEEVLTCLENGKWSNELPFCEELSTCPDPGNAPNADKLAPSGNAKISGRFIEGVEIQYTCKAGFERLGTDIIRCLYDGTWSDEIPSCIKVSAIVPDCLTPGSTVIDDIGMSVRILCPPECADQEFRVWGTSIYRWDSSVCQAAIHSNKITNSGGFVAVINNGAYSHFTGSHSNNIKSESYAGREQSFRFDKLPPLIASRASNECPKGMEKIENTCVYVSSTIRSYQEAKGICHNMGLQLELPNEHRELVSLLAIKGISSVWSSGQTTNSDENRCIASSVSNLEFVPEKKHCSELLNYICISGSDTVRLASCENPGELRNGNVQPIGQIDGVYYVGSSIKFTCDSLHYLNGEEVISCTLNGTWSDKMPDCVKVDACEDPPIPVGGFVTYLPPLKSPAQQRAVIGRMGVYKQARLPTGLAMPLPSNMPLISTASPMPETISLPPGIHRTGTRAMYDCESRYYTLVGSRTRRCQGQGEWSGRAPNCIPVCGRSDSPRTPFIVNGNATDIGQWPWQVGVSRYVQEREKWYLFCGASLISERWVVTAAHCVTYPGTTLIIDANVFRVYVGKYHRDDSKDDDYVQTRKVHEIHIHPDYDPGLFDADIALLQLDSPIQLNSRVQPICLPTEASTRENISPGKKGVVTGWGTNENKTDSETLQQAVLPVISSSQCEQGYRESELPLTVTENMYCAGYEQGRMDTCNGDSGGPMVFADNSSKERKWVLEGIVSWGSPNGCGNPKQYAGFTLVSKFLDWIHLFV